MKKENVNQPAFEEVCRFIIKLGEQVHGYGANAHSMDNILNRITKAFNYQGIFNSTPNEIHFSFSENGGIWQKTHISVMSGLGTELNKLGKVGDLIIDIENGKLSISDAFTQLDKIDAHQHPWGNFTTALSYMMCGAAFPVLMGGTWTDLIFSGIFSLVAFFMVVKSTNWGPLYAVWLPFSTAFVAGIMAAITRYFFPELNMMLVVLSSVLILIPGYGVSVGIVEFVTDKINSGLSNLVTNVIYLIKQFIGGLLGVKVVTFFISLPVAVTATPIDSVWLFLFMPLIIIGLGIALQTPYRDFFWACFAMLISYLSTIWGSELVGLNFGNLLGMILLVLFSSTWARITKRPYEIVLVPAFILLVSGTIGFRGLANIASGDLMSGAMQFIQMFIVAFTLAAGLIIGVTLINPEKHINNSE